ncbi:RNA 2',3'-cyclic phosphodiesterase [Bordetella bronchiseptica]|uniref:RNA 2',3'-cyclic phosphodiesterase n=1 Tax=Bordetella bronchiseptica TaxID=518 RepID=UPI000C1A578C|nr:RNA 2',3'-cyclic phosphodiesterase [Bordetella bronchiseptica]
MLRSSRASNDNARMAHPPTEAAIAPPRLFFALWPDPATAARLADWAAHAQLAYGGRVMRTDTLHLTLAFLGAATPAQAAELCAATAARRIAPATLALARYGLFARQRIVWAGPQQADAALAALHDDLWTWLRALGWPAPQQGFQPHVTLLRNVDAHAAAPAPPPPVAWRYDHHALVQSQPQHGRASYRVLARTAA